MKYLATIAASILFLTPFATFAQTTQEQHDTLILQLITLLTQEVQALQAQLNAQIAATGGTPDTTTLGATTNPIIQQITMPEDQSQIIIHDDSEFYNNPTYSIFVQNKDGIFDPTTVATITENGVSQEITLNALTLFDTSTAMTAPHRENGTLYHPKGTFTVSAEGLDKTITI